MTVWEALISISSGVFVLLIMFGADILDIIARRNRR